MSFKSAEKIHHTANTQIFFDKPIIYSNLIIPFSEFGKKESHPDIYNGEEKIAFKEKHPIFQIIFKNEFENS